MVLLGCSAKPSRAAPPPPHVDELAARLGTCKLTDLATGLAMDPEVSEVWRAYSDPTSYVALIEDSARPMPMRFAAALMLRSVSVVQFKKVDARAVSQVFAAALRDDLAGYAFPWGWLWAPGDAVGLGQVFLELGAPAKPALIALLDDATPRETYLGTAESAAMAGRHYRVKDFAAFYLARIADLDLAWQADLARRDDAIARLRAQLTGAPLPSRALEVGDASQERTEHGVAPPRFHGARNRTLRGECPVLAPTTPLDVDSLCRRRSRDHR